VLAHVEQVNTPDFTLSLLKQTLIFIHRRLAEVQVEYPVPMRISAAGTIGLMNAFVAERSGGDRVQAVAPALLLVIGQRFGLFDSIQREAINAADLSTGLIADLECVLNTGEIVLAVEVKDKELSIGDIDAKLQTARARQVAEILFVAQHGIRTADRERLEERLESHFASGQNVYVLTLSKLAKVAFSLLGERSRPEFLRLVGNQLDQFKSDIRHRRAWKELLAGT